MTERKIRSNRQAEASRKNGAKSRGPTSADGKARSSRNAKTHGLTGKFEPTAGERDDVEEFARKLRSHYNPDDPVKAALIERATIASARLNRARALITEMAEDLADPGNPRRRQDLALESALIRATRDAMVEIYGGEPPSLSLAKAVAEQVGYAGQTARSNSNALQKLARYARRFRGERDRALARLSVAERKQHNEGEPLGVRTRESLVPASSKGRHRR